jgi:hypothetical protein
VYDWRDGDQLRGLAEFPYERIGEFDGNPKTCPFAQLLIDCEGRMLPAVLVGMLLEADR